MVADCSVRDRKWGFKEICSQVIVRQHLQLEEMCLCEPVCCACLSGHVWQQERRQLIMPVSTERHGASKSLSFKAPGKGRCISQGV